MGDGSFGLTIGIGADPSEAVEAVSALDKVIAESASKNVQNFGRVNETLLNQHESVHLLADELGLHLPRAVLGGISEILPSINQLGTGLLAAFAVKEVSEFGEYVKKDAEALEGLADAEKKLKEVAQESLGDLKNLTIQQLQMETQRAAVRLANEEREYQHIRRIAEIDAALLPGVWHVYDKLFQTHTQEHLDEMKKTVEADRALIDQLNKLVGEDEKGAHEKAAKSARELADALAQRNKQDEDYLNKTLKNNIEGDRQYYASQQALLKAIHDTTDAMNAEAAQEQRLKEIHTTLMEMGVAQLPLQRQEIQNLQILAPYIDAVTEKTVHLNAVRRVELEIMQALNAAGEHEAKATAKDLVAATENVADGFASLIGGQRAAAAVSCIFDAAKGAEQVAMALDPYDPNHALHWISAAQFFVASAEFGKIAGTSTHHHTAGAARSGGRGSYGGSGGGDDGYRVQPPQQTLAASAQTGRYGSPGSGVIVVHGSTDLHQWVAGIVNEAVSRGITVTATSSQRGAPVGH